MCAVCNSSTAGPPKRFQLIEYLSGEARRQQQRQMSGHVCAWPSTPVRAQQGRRRWRWQWPWRCAKKCLSNWRVGMGMGHSNACSLSKILNVHFSCLVAACSLHPCSYTRTDRVIWEKIEKERVREGGREGERIWGQGESNPILVHWPHYITPVVHTVHTFSPPLIPLRRPVRFAAPILVAPSKRTALFVRSHVHPVQSSFVLIHC